MRAPRWLRCRRRRRRRRRPTCARLLLIRNRASRNARLYAGPDPRESTPGECAMSRGATKRGTPADARVVVYVWAYGLLWDRAHYMKTQNGKCFLARYNCWNVRRSYERSRKITGSLIIEFFSRDIEMKGKINISRDPSDEYNSMDSIEKNSFLYNRIF